MKRNILTSCLLALIFAISLLVSSTQSVDAFQFVDRILRPCGGTSTGIVIVTTTDINLNPCPGGSVKINGTPITPGAGLPDPGSNGFVVRTALNTDVARTLTANGGISITNGTGVAGNPVIDCPTCVTSLAALTNNAIMTGAGLRGSQTVSSLTTLAANGDIVTPGSLTTGSAGGVSGAIDLFGLTSGTVTVTVKNVAGTWTLTLPDSDGTPGQFLQTDGSGITSWQTVTGFTCAACASNTVQKGNGAGNLANSRILDNGTDITANSGAGVFRAGDTSLGANGSFFEINDPGKQIRISADDNNTGTILSLTGGASPEATLVNGSGVGSVELKAVGTQFIGSSASGLLVRSATTDVLVRGNTLQPEITATSDLGSTSSQWKQLFLDATITAGGTTGNQTINKAAGSVNFAAAATSLTVTSNTVTTNSIVMCTVATNDTTLKSVQCVPSAGSFTMFGNAAATAETRVNFWILNQ